MRRNICAFALLAALTTVRAASDGPVAPEVAKDILDHRHPRLVVVMVVDQLLGDYLTRFSDQFLGAGNAVEPGGFRYLMERGAHFADAHYSHIPTFTGPGHSVVMSGAPLSRTGIVANDWITTQGARMYCVGDAETQVVGAPAVRRFGSSSPRNMEAGTVGDELRLATNGAAKVVGIAVKDRAAILLSGRNPDAAVWFDSASGKWVTSTWYTTGTLPGFAQGVNEAKIADRWLGKKWDLLLPGEAYSRSHASGAARGTQKAAGLGGGFPKALGDQPDKDYYARVTFSPFGNEMTFEVAKAAVRDERLGHDAAPDILALNFSSVDLAGHSYGPNSPEMQDMILRTDQQVADFLGFLAKELPGGLDAALIVVTSDHGVAPIPEWASDFARLDAGRTLFTRFYDEASSAVARRFPDKDTRNLVTGFAEPYLYFNQPLLETLGIDRVAAQEAVADAYRRLDGVHAVYPRWQVERGQLPPSRIAAMIANGFHPERSGDVFVLMKPFWYASSSPAGTTHGSGYNYDTHVPILFAGRGVRPGTYIARADVKDIAPTISFLLGVKPPSSSEGRILGEMLR
jgi:predicted AlkP superfamily pyrophosphatase or phosphodiesterase